MFDLIMGKTEHVPSTPAVPILISAGVQTTALAGIVIASLVFATGQLPVPGNVLAFVAEMPSPLPPPPPPAPALPKAAAAPRPEPMSGFAAPVEAPPTIEPEVPFAGNGEEGVPGGVEGGIPGGIVGGFAGVIEGPPPPPPPPPKREIMRIGGQVQAPALVRRVDPEYPALAQAASIDGVVILDAIVDVEGHVQSVTTLRGHPLLARAAIDAVKQWQYQPLLLNGVPTPFELTVSLWFHFEDKNRR